MKFQDQDPHQESIRRSHIEKIEVNNNKNVKLRSSHLWQTDNRVVSKVAKYYYVRYSTYDTDVSSKYNFKCHVLLRFFFFCYQWIRFDPYIN